MLFAPACCNPSVRGAVILLFPPAAVSGSCISSKAFWRRRRSPVPRERVLQAGKAGRQVGGQRGDLLAGIHVAGARILAEVGQLRVDAPARTAALRSVCSARRKAVSSFSVSDGSCAGSSGAASVSGSSGCGAGSAGSSGCGAGRIRSSCRASSDFFSCSASSAPSCASVFTCSESASLSACACSRRFCRPASST